MMDTNTMTETRLLTQYRYDKKCRQESGWDSNARKSFEFAFGVDQWPTDIRRELERTGRPVLMFNVILPAVDLIVGHMIETSGDLIAIPVDKQADPTIAKFITMGIKNIEYLNEMPMQRKAQFIDGLLTGVGVKEKMNDTEDDIDGKIKCQHLPSLELYLDPNFKKQDYSDARRFTREKWLTKDEILAIYGKKAVRNLPESKDDVTAYIESHVSGTYNEITDYGNMGGTVTPGAVTQEMEYGYDVKNKKYRVIEVFEKQWSMKELYYDGEKWSDAGVLSEEEYALVEPTIVNKRRSVIKLYSLVGLDLVQEIETDADTFGRLFDFFFPYFYNGYYMGVVKNLIDPQMEINKRYSTIIHILTSIANTGMFYKRGAFGEGEQDLGSLLASNDKAIPMDELYDENGRTNYIQRTPPIVPPIYERLEETNAERIKYISGAGDAIQGNVPRKQSGVAKRKEIEQSAIRLLNIIDNFRYALRQEGKAIIWMIQKYKTEEWFFRIYGSDGSTQQEIVLNKRAMGEIFNNVTVGEYDIVLSFEGKSNTEREATFWKLVELANTAPQFADIIALEALDNFSLPEKDKIKEQWMQRQQQIAQQGQIPGVQPGQGVRREPQRLQA